MAAPRRGESLVICHRGELDPIDIRNLERSTVALSIAKLWSEKRETEQLIASSTLLRHLILVDPPDASTVSAIRDRLKINTEQPVMLALIAISGLDRAAQTTMIRASAAKMNLLVDLIDDTYLAAGPEKSIRAFLQTLLRRRERMGDRRHRLGSVLRSDAGRDPLWPDRAGASRVAQNEPPQSVRRIFSSQSLCQAVRGGGCLAHRAIPGTDPVADRRAGSASEDAAQERRCYATWTISTILRVRRNFSASTSIRCANGSARFAKSPAAGTTRFPRWNCTWRCASIRSLPRREWLDHA